MTTQKNTAMIATVFFLLQVSMISQAADLSSNMKAMGKLFKQIKNNVANPAKNTATVDAAKKFLVILDAVLEQVPDTLSKLPASKRPEALDAYKKLIVEEKLTTQSLIEALTRDKEHPDNMAATRFATQMKDLEGRGHDQFK